YSLTAHLRLLYSFPTRRSSDLNLVIMTLYATLLGQAWNILAGFGGQYSFGHAAFFGTGAYASAALQVHFGVNAWLCLPFAIVCGDRKSTRLNSSHQIISYAVSC